MKDVFALLLVFQAKHFLADFPLQGRYMLGKFKPGWDFLSPLLAHVSVHGLMTLAICLYVRPALWWLALVDMVAHFAMDRIKAGPKYLGRWKPDNKLFWWALGIDQAWHHLTHYAIIWALVTP
jgi:uncharacterized membrane protein